jgi:hypothetical protein
MDIAFRRYWQYPTEAGPIKGVRHLEGLSVKRFAALLLAFGALAAQAQPLSILFAGNSFTYTRPPVLQYNIENVADLNYANFLANPAGSDPALPQPWGGIPGVIEVLADQAGLDYEVHHSLRGGATLRGHYLNTNPAGWNLRANVAYKKWDVVVLQGNSTEAVARAGGNPPQFRAYVNKLERYVHVGAAETYRESQLYPGGGNALRTIPANPNANPDAAVYLYQTWTRPDLAYLPDGDYYGEPLETMGHEVRDAYALAASLNGNIAGVIPSGEAFLRAVQSGVALRNPYAPDAHGVDLWWHEDQFHPSKYGSYLSALVIFGSVSGIDPASFGANEKAAADLGIEPLHALQLQRVASEQLAASGMTGERRNCLHASPRANGARTCAGQ